MIVPPEIQRKHNFVRPYIDNVADRVRDTVRTYCESNGFAYLGRTKAAESLAEKIETGRYSRWRDLDDLFACSIIIPTLAKEESVLEFLQNTFVEVECKKRATSRKDPLVFRFDATRFIGTLSTRAVPQAPTELLNLRFEVQIRTAFEHAWSVTTHSLAYKSATVDWRRLRLAAQLRAAVEQLDQVVSAFEQSATFIADQAWPEVVAKQLIEVFFQDKARSIRLPPETAPENWTRFCDNLYSVVLASQSSFVRDAPGLVSRALELIDREIATTTQATFPRSISLLQFCIGALAKHGLLSAPSKRYTPLLTRELLELYPASSAMGAGFDFEIGDA